MEDEQHPTAEMDEDEPTEQPAESVPDSGPTQILERPSKPGPKGCHGQNVNGGACGAPVVWNRDAYGVKTTPTMYCFRHSYDDATWRERAAKGGRAKAAEDSIKRRIVTPMRAREIIRIIVNVVNETWSLRIAMEHLAPFCTADDHDRELLLQELSRLRTLSERTEEARVQAQSERIEWLTRGQVF